ncbi:hypothetical protein VNI00_016328 [Paramarasmius palmivorus]|uniref:Protein kinase domain-containing protein n=1 Tax=Paramarasmius palmivorus TaxID=297713 RepID=A0AAW0BF98_9AGAR
MDPKDEEEEVFAPLVDGFNAILDILSELTGAEKHIKFSNTFSSLIKTQRSDYSYKSDMAVSLTQTMTFGREAGEQHDHEWDVVVLGEYDKCSSRWCTDDNIARIVGNASGLLGRDPTRRFTYGLTIENTNVQFWFFSRSHVYVTENLDIHKDTKALIYFVLALGSSSKVELGFDPTVQRVPYGPAKEPVYRFTIDGHQYQAVQSIRGWKAYTILGSASRIYKVRRVLPSGELSKVVEVMKDLWIPEGIRTEYDLRQAIKVKINKVNPVEGLDPQAFDRHFVKIEGCEFVQVPSTSDRQSLVNDSSTNFLRHATPPEYEILHLQSTSSASRRNSCFRSPTSTPEHTCERLEDGDYDHRTQANTADLRRLKYEQYKNLTHCRILMEDAGRPLFQVRDMRTFIVCIVQTITALMFLYSAGFVHRDISAGNILVSEENGEVICKLSDLETAKEINSENGYPLRDVNVGTPLYMATEVASGHWQFQPSPPSPKLTPNECVLLGSLEEDETSSWTQPLHKLKEISFNFLHDLESLFWICMHFLVEVHARDEEISNRLTENRLRDFDLVFWMSRWTFFRGTLGVVLQSSVSSRLYSVYRYLYHLARILEEEYRRIENTTSETTLDVSVDVYKKLQTWLHDLLACDSPNLWLGEVVNTKEYVSADRKRKAGTSIDNASAKEAKRHAGSGGS